MCVTAGKVLVDCEVFALQQLAAVTLQWSRMQAERDG